MSKPKPSRFAKIAIWMFFTSFVLGFMGLIVGLVVGPLAWSTIAVVGCFFIAFVNAGLSIWACETYDIRTWQDINPFRE
jgi:hypothetical protein